MDEKLAERAEAAVALGDRTGSRGKSPSNIYNVAADLLEALTLAQARIRELETALAARSAEPVAPLFRARFKLSFNSVGSCTTFKHIAREIDGKWVWLIDATDGKNDPLYTHPKEAPDV